MKSREEKKRAELKFREEKERAEWKLREAELKSRERILFFFWMVKAVPKERSLGAIL